MKVTEGKGSKIKVLYVDDEENNLISFKATFRLKYKVYTAISGPAAIDIIKTNPIDIIITDQRMPEMTGVEFLEEIIKIDSNPMRILLTGYTDMSAVIGAVNKGKIFHYLNKPWNEDELDQTIQRAYEVYMERNKIIEENSKLELSNEQLEFLLRQKLLS
ncbi:MAG TPA: response regulator [Sphingobacterium sp.]|nr:response regulator [Sphingobacterium sp.]